MLVKVDVQNRDDTKRTTLKLEMNWLGRCKMVVGPNDEIYFSSVEHVNPITGRCKQQVSSAWMCIGRKDLSLLLKKTDRGP
jgi:hypothetical protein